MRSEVMMVRQGSSELLELWLMLWVSWEANSLFAQRATQAAC
jgi:hypothetical protein